MLEEILRAVDAARMKYLERQLRDDHHREFFSRLAAREAGRFVELSPGSDPSETPSVGWLEASAREASEFVVVYDSPHEDRRVTYSVGSSYRRSSGYRMPSRDIFYVHVPAWASIRTVDQLELGEHVLGTAHLHTGEIRLLDSLDPAERTEVLLHESLHLLYPMHSEGQIRDLVRTIMGKQYCRFH